MSLHILHEIECYAFLFCLIRLWFEHWFFFLSLFFATYSISGHWSLDIFESFIIIWIFLGDKKKPKQCGITYFRVYLVTYINRVFFFSWTVILLNISQLYNGKFKIEISAIPVFPYLTPWDAFTSF